MKQIVVLLLALTLIITPAACSGGEVEYTTAVSTSQPASEPGDNTGIAVSEEQNSDNTTTASSDSGQQSGAEAVSITLGDKITVSGAGVTVDGSKITVTSAGTYSLSGTLKDGQILVNTQDEETVTLILNGADITCSTSAPIYVLN